MMRIDEMWNICINIARCLIVILFTIDHPLLEARDYKYDLASILRRASTETKEYQYDLAAALIFKDEAPYLKEWIEYHKLVGFQHFYLYNNESSDHFKDILLPYILSGEVELYDWSGNPWNLPNINNANWNAIQCLAYVNAVNKAKQAKVKWIAILDSDEFLVPAHHESLVTLLSQYDENTIGGISVKWVMFGTSHVSKIPENALLIETLVLNYGWNCIGEKSIFRPERVNLDCSKGPLIGQHYPEYLPGWGSLSLEYRDIQCNHYWSRDEFFLHHVKIPRRLNWETSENSCLEWVDQYNQSTPAGGVILRFIPELRQRMGFE
jgi:hypothetical protein